MWSSPFVIMFLQYYSCVIKQVYLPFATISSWDRTLVKYFYHVCFPLRILWAQYSPNTLLPGYVSQLDIDQSCVEYGLLVPASSVYGTWTLVKWILLLAISLAKVSGRSLQLPHSQRKVCRFIKSVSSHCLISRCSRLHRRQHSSSKVKNIYVGSLE